MDGKEGGNPDPIDRLGDNSRLQNSTDSSFELLLDLSQPDSLEETVNSTLQTDILRISAVGQTRLRGLVQHALAPTADPDETASEKGKTAQQGSIGAPLGVDTTLKKGDKTKMNQDDKIDAEYKATSTESLQAQITVNSQINSESEGLNVPDEHDSSSESIAIVGYQSAAGDWEGSHVSDQLEEPIAKYVTRDGQDKAETVTCEAPHRSNTNESKSTNQVTKQANNIAINSNTTNDPVTKDNTTEKASMSESVVTQHVTTRDAFPRDPVLAIDMDTSLDLSGDALVIDTDQDTLSHSREMVSESECGPAGLSGGKHVVDTADNDSAVNKNPSESVIDNDTGGKIVEKSLAETDNETSEDLVGASESNTTQPNEPEIVALQPASAELVLNMAKRAAIRQSAESQGRQQYTRCDLMLHRILDPEVFSTAKGERQLYVDDAAEKSGTLSKDMRKSMLKCLNDKTEQFSCPRPTVVSPAPGECLYKKYSYSKLVQHLIITHDYDFGLSKIDGVKPLDVSHASSTYICKSCDFTAGHPVLFIEHVRLHVTGHVLYKCEECADTLSLTQIKLHYENAQTCKNLFIKIPAEVANLILQHRFTVPGMRRCNAFYDVSSYIQQIMAYPIMQKVTTGARLSFKYLPSTKSFACSACLYKTEVVDAFLEHLRCHLSAEPYTCATCQHTFGSASLFSAPHNHDCTTPILVPDESVRWQMEETLKSMLSFHPASPGQPATLTTPSDPESAHNPVTSQAHEDDVITYFDCVTHNIQTPVYIDYLKHLVDMHTDFTKVNHKQGANQTIAFKEGQYICTGCDLKTTLRVVFQEHMRCHMLQNPYTCTLCGIDYKSFIRSHQPCNEKAKFTVRASTAMESLMAKLGPMAPATTRAEEVGFTQADPHGTTSQSGIDGEKEIVEIIDDDVEVVQSPTPSPPQTTGTESVTALDKSRNLLQQALATSAVTPPRTQQRTVAMVTESPPRSNPSPVRPSPRKVTKKSPASARQPNRPIFNTQSPINSGAALNTGETMTYTLIPINTGQQMPAPMTMTVNPNQIGTPAMLLNQGVHVDSISVKLAPLTPGTVQPISITPTPRNVVAAAQSAPLLLPVAANPLLPTAPVAPTPTSIGHTRIVTPRPVVSILPRSALQATPSATTTSSPPFTVLRIADGYSKNATSANPSSYTDVNTGHTTQSTVIALEPDESHTQEVGVSDKHVVPDVTVVTESSDTSRGLRMPLTPAPDVNPSAAPRNTGPTVIEFNTNPPSPSARNDTTTGKTKSRGLALPLALGEQTQSGKQQNLEEFTKYLVGDAESEKPVNRNTPVAKEDKGANANKRENVTENTKFGSEKENKKEQIAEGTKVDNVEKGEITENKIEEGEEMTTRDDKVTQESEVTVEDKTEIDNVNNNQNESDSESGSGSSGGSYTESEDEADEDGLVRRRESVLRCDITDGRYTCYTCEFSTFEGKSFKQHLVGHTHAQTDLCEHLPASERHRPHKCPIILGLVQLFIQKTQGHKLDPQEIEVHQEKLPAYYEDEKPETSDKNLGTEDTPAEAPVNVETSSESEAEESAGENESFSLVISDVCGGVSDINMSTEEMNLSTSQVQTIAQDEETVDKAPNDEQHTRDVTMEIGNVTEESGDVTMRSDDVAVESNDVTPESGDISGISGDTMDSSASMYQCAVQGCVYSTEQQQEFIEHCRTQHAGQQVFNCKCCKKASFLDPTDLAVHIYNTTEARQHSLHCPFCAFSTSQLNTLERHIQKRHIYEQKFPCNFCGVNFDEVTLLFNHLRHTIVKVLSCPYCKEQFSEKRDLMSHIGVKHAGEPRRMQVSRNIRCQGPSRGKPESPRSMDKSITVHKEKPATDAHKLSAPRRGSATSLNASPARRSSAASQSPSQKALSRQSSDTEGPALSRLDCTQCDFQAFSKAQLESHVMWHESAQTQQQPVTRFRCPVCPCAVQSFADFRFHLQFHKRESKVKYYECASCAYRSNDEDSMESHHQDAHVTGSGSGDDSDEEATYMVKKLKVSFHSGRYTCPQDQCAESFAQIVALQEHCVQQHGHPLADKHRLDFYSPDGAALEHTEHFERAHTRPKQPSWEETAIKEDFDAKIKIKDEPADGTADETLSLITRYHCDLCEFNTNSSQRFHLHMTNMHPGKGSTEHLSATSDVNSEISGDIPSGAAEVVGDFPRAETSGDFPQDTSVDSDPIMERSDDNLPTKPAPRELKCHICAYTSTNRKTMQTHRKQHRRFEDFTGYAFKCPYCAYIVQQKGSCSLHVKKHHADKPHNVMAVQMDHGKILHEAISQFARKPKQHFMPQEEESHQMPRLHSPPHITAQQKSPVMNEGETVSHEPEADDGEENGESSEEETWDNHPADTTREFHASTGEIPIHQDPDSITDLNKDDEAFCNKVSGLNLYQCKLCSFMAQQCESVRLHYVSTHDTELPLLCFYCRERCDEASLRAHMQTLHPSDTVKVIRLIRAESGEHTPLDLLEGEMEILQEVDERGKNDWSAGTLPLVTKLPDTYQCNICMHKVKRFFDLKNHVLPTHFGHYPLVCGYCFTGNVSYSKIKSHCEGMHPGLPYRVRKQLPMSPSDQQIHEAKQRAATRTRPGRSVDLSPGRSNSQSSLKSGATFLDPNAVQPDSADAGVPAHLEQPQSVEKAYKCLYCNHTSKWTSRDVQRHVLSAHLGLKLFNCMYCEHGHDGRSELETHCSATHPGKPFKFSPLDKSMNSIRVVREEDGGAEVFGLHKPNGDPVMKLDPAQSKLLREFAMSRKHAAFEAKKKSASPKKAGKIAPKSQAAKPHTIGGKKATYQCQLCELVLDKIEKVKYHVICHHWKKRPYVCPECQTHKYQREQVRVHMEKEHPDSSLRPLNVVETHARELKECIRVIDPDSTSEAAMPEKPEVDTDTTEDEDQALLPQEELWRCEEPGCAHVAPYRELQCHVIVEHLNTQVYLCDFCDAAHNDIEKMIKHLKKSHASYPQRFTHAYGRYKDEVDALISRNDASPKRSTSDEARNAQTGNEDKTNAVSDAENRCRMCDFKGESLAHAQEHMEEEHLQHVTPGDDMPHRPTSPNQTERDSGFQSPPPPMTSSVTVHDCDYCAFASPSARDLARHVTLMHGLSGEGTCSTPRTSQVETQKDDKSSQQEKPKKVASQSAVEYACTHCSYVSREKAGMRRHVMVHVHYQPYCCPCCDVTGVSKDHVRQHMIASHRGQKGNIKMKPNAEKEKEIERCIIKRNLAKTIAKSPAALRKRRKSSMRRKLSSTHRHKRTRILGKRLYFCRICGHRSGFRSAVVQHIMTHLDYKKFQCPHCDFTATQTKTISGHVRNEHPRMRRYYVIMMQPQLEKQVQRCVTQSDDLLRKRKVTKASATALNKYWRLLPRLKCRICGYRVRGHVYMNRHIRAHLGYRKFGCPYCDATSVERQSIIAHVQQDHPDNQPCYRTRLQTKMEINLQENIIHCDEQKLKKSPVKGPKRRMGTYKSNKKFGRYSCKICGFHKNNVNDVRDHIGIHLKYKKYLCKACSYRGATITSIKSHTKAIHQSKSKQKFIETRRNEEMETQVSELLVHGKQAAREFHKANYEAQRALEAEEYGSNFKCNICSAYKTTHISSIKYHVMRHMGYSRYKCMHCEKSCGRRKEILTHARQFHPDKRPPHIDTMQHVMREAYSSTKKRGKKGAQDTTEDSEDGPAASARLNIKELVAQSNGLKGANKSELESDESRASVAQASTSVPRNEGRPGGKVKYTTEREAKPSYKCLVCFEEFEKRHLIRYHISSHINYSPFCCFYCDFKSSEPYKVRKHQRKLHGAKKQKVITRWNKTHDEKIDELTECLDIKRRQSLESISETSQTSAKRKAEDEQTQDKSSVEPRTLKTMKEGGNIHQTSVDTKDESAHKQKTKKIKLDDKTKSKDTKKEKPSIKPISQSNDTQRKTEVVQSTSKPKEKSSKPISQSHTEDTKSAQSTSSNKSTVSQDGAVEYVCVLEHEGKPCGYKSTLPYAMMNHIMYKMNYKPYACPRCDFTDIGPRDLKKHMSRKHRGEKLEPVMRKDEKLADLVEELMQKSIVRSYKRRSSQESNVSHKRRASQDSNESKERSHKRRASQESNGSIKDVDKSVKKRKKEDPLFEHTPTQAAPKNAKKPSTDEVSIPKPDSSTGEYRCLYCEKRFHDEAHISAHMLEHSQAPRWRCDHCQKAFKSIAKLKKHSSLRGHRQLNYTNMSTGVRYEQGIKVLSKDSVSETSSVPKSKGESSDFNLAEKESESISAASLKVSDDRGTHMTSSKPVPKSSKPTSSASPALSSKVKASKTRPASPSVKTKRSRDSKITSQQVKLLKQAPADMTLHIRSQSPAALQKAQRSHSPSVSHGSASPRPGPSSPPARPLSRSSASGSVTSAASSGAKTRKLVFCCPHCKYVTLADVNLLAHLQIHKADRGGKSRCAFCGFTSHKHTDFTEHARKHVRSRPYKCGHCNDVFKLRTQVTSHSSAEHPGDKVKVQIVEAPSSGETWPPGRAAASGKSGKRKSLVPHFDARVAVRDFEKLSIPTLHKLMIRYKLQEIHQ